MSLFNKAKWVQLGGMIVVTTSACTFQLGGLKPTEAFPGIHGRLVEAAVDGNTSAMENLVKQGADPNYRGAQGSTPLMWVMGAHNHRGLEKLVELGADPNVQLPVGGTATRVAAGGNDYETLKIILEHGGNPNVMSGCKTSLMAAIDAMEIRRIDLLLAHGADINGEACNHGAPEVSAILGRFDLALYLLSKGYNNNLNRLAIWSNNSFVPKDSKAYQDKQQVLEILRQRGATIPALKQ